MSFDFAIFDLDGTLLDTEPVYTAVTQQLLDPYGKTFTWELKQQMMGKEALVSARLLVETLGIDLAPEDYLARRKPLIEEGCRTAPEIAGAPEFVEGLAARGVRMGVATSSSQRLCDMKLGWRPWSRHFEVFVCGDDPAVKRSKPAPDIFLEAARRLGADPARTLAFEDSPSGIEAARAAGMHVVAVVDPRLDRARFADTLQIAGNFVELMPLLERVG